MPTTPRYTHRLTTVSSSVLTKKITQAFLDTKPGSPLRSRLEDIMLNRINASAVTAAKYYTATLQGLGDVLRDPKFPPFNTPSRPRKVHRSLTVPVRKVALPKYNFPAQQVYSRREPVGQTIPAVASTTGSNQGDVTRTTTKFTVPKRIRSTTIFLSKGNASVGAGEMKGTVNMEGYTRSYGSSKTYLRTGNIDKIAGTVANLPLSRPTKIQKGSTITVSTNYKELSQRHLSRIPATERVTLESGVRRPSAWKGLGFNYRYGLGFWKGYQESRSFWRKTGRLSAAYDAWFERNLPRLSDPSLYVGHETARKITYPSVKGTGSRARLAHVTFAIKTPPLNMTIAKAVDSALQRSFIQGKAAEIGPPTVRQVASKRVRRGDKRITIRSTEGNQLVVRNIVGLDRLHSPEYNRPFVARYMAEMGRRYENTLRNVLKPR